MKVRTCRVHPALLRESSAAHDMLAGNHRLQARRRRSRLREVAQTCQVRTGRFLRECEMRKRLRLECPTEHPGNGRPGHLVVEDLSTDTITRTCIERGV